MGKQLTEMTQEELCRLFPILLKEHSPAYTLWYKQERDALRSALGERGIARLSHIGSTAVPGLLAKPTVDILLETRLSSAELRATLRNAGWLLMAEKHEPELRLSFNKGYTPQGFAERVFHLHAHRPCDPPELYFRDYLLAHPEAVREYAALKRSLLKPYRYDRDGYTDAKTAFVREITQKARLEFPGRYVPGESEMLSPLDSTGNME